MRIVAYDDSHQEAFSALNRAWLDSAGLFEAADEDQLAHPRETILDAGGSIFVAMNATGVVGTAALIPAGPRAYELTKVTVEQSARRLGVGRALVERCLAHARERGAERVTLLSNRRLTEALRLYETLGFVRRDLPPSSKYATADVCMERWIKGSSMT